MLTFCFPDSLFVCCSPFSEMRFSNLLVSVAALALLASAASLASAQAPTPPVIDVTAYGAVGDGKTDNTAAVGKAVAALVANPTGTLYFPPGAFLLSSKPTTPSFIQLELGSLTSATWNIVGASTDQTAVIWNSQQGWWVTATAGVSVSIGSMIVEELPVPAGTQWVSGCIVLQGAKNSAINDFALLLQDGLGLTIDSGAHTILLQSVLFNGTGTGMQIENADDIAIEGCVFQGNGARDPNAMDGIELWGNVTNLRLSNSFFKGLQNGINANLLPGPNEASIYQAAFIDITEGSILVGSALQLTVSTSLFNNSIGAPVGGTGVWLLPGTGGANIVVEGSMFNGLQFGVKQQGGHVTAQNNGFVNGTVGFLYEPSTVAGSTDDRSPFVLEYNEFSGNGAADVTSTGGSLWVVSNNVCMQGNPGGITLKCLNADGTPTTDCVLGNNNGCNVQQ